MVSSRKILTWNMKATMIIQIMPQGIQADTFAATPRWEVTYTYLYLRDSSIFTSDAQVYSRPPYPFLSALPRLKSPRPEEGLATRLAGRFEDRNCAMHTSRLLPQGLALLRQIGGVR